MQWIAVLLGNFLDGGGLFQHFFGLRHDLRAERCDRKIGVATFENRHAKFVFELFDSHR